MLPHSTVGLFWSGTAHWAAPWAAVLLSTCLASREAALLEMLWDVPCLTPRGQQGGMGTHTPSREDTSRDIDVAGAGAPCCTFLGCSPAVSGPSTSYLPQRPFFLEHSHHHAHGNHQAGEHSHEDAQGLCPGGELVVAILRRLVLDNVIHQQSLWDGKKARSSQRSHAQKDLEMMDTSQKKDGLWDRRCQLITPGGPPGALAALWCSSTIQQPKLSCLPSSLLGTGPSSKL